MGLPKFTAELSLHKSTRVYRGRVVYGNITAHSASPANVMPSQFEGLEGFAGLDDMDETALLADTDAVGADFGDTGDADFGDTGDADFEDSADGEDGEYADEELDVDEAG
jgi:hypothetical protein